jgi:N-glycosylase/DNA lyase
MNRTYVPNLNLEISVLSGQTFSWTRKGEWLLGIFTDSIILAKQEGDYLIWQTYPEEDNFDLIEKYFRLDEDYDQLIKDISIDNYTKQAAQKFYGLRNLRQDFEQTLFSFILASNKNIKAIRQSINIFRNMGGKQIDINGEKIHLFPGLEFFRQATLEELSKARVGYRAKYLKNAAIFLEESREYSRDKLLEIHGVGPKIADCVASFALDAKHITPIDRWSERIISELYQENVGNKYEDKSSWFTNKFQNNTALAGQFLFEYMRGYNPSDYL